MRCALDDAVGLVKYEGPDDGLRCGGTEGARGSEDARVEVVWWLPEVI